MTERLRVGMKLRLPDGSKGKILARKIIYRYDIDTEHDGFYIGCSEKMTQEYRKLYRRQAGE